MKAEVKNIYQASDVHEISVDFNGNNYLVIYGRHINGWFIAIPNWDVCVEAAPPEDVFYNSERIAHSLKRKTAAKELAAVIKAHYEFLQSGGEIQP